MIRFGLLGCGRITARGLIPGIKGSQTAELTALASERPGVAAEWAREHGARKSYTSYEAVLADPEIDAVYIPTTGETHAKWTIAAAEAKKHVLCEKPLAMDVKQAEEMAAACRQHGVLLQEAFMWRHHPRTKQALHLIQKGDIGPLRMIVASFSFDIDRNDWRLRPERGGGAMWDVGCYGVNAARLFAGAEPVEVLAAAHWAPTGVDMTMQIALRFPGDVLA
ncbi:MAG TPA: Gfo/Idh/MocA family oxidoreductase, partial [Caulifigura sp.]|nr:Gfo/Idh/MocA family oxidoreductase [Caulifigura sp.]